LFYRALSGSAQTQSHLSIYPENQQRYRYQRRSTYFIKITPRQLENFILTNDDKHKRERPSLGISKNTNEGDVETIALVQVIRTSILRDM